MKSESNIGTNKKLKIKAMSNFVWRFSERCGAQLVTFVVTMVLARKITPEEYGLVALITVITGILQVFVDSGFGNALIQKKDADNEDFSTVFYFNVCICLILYGSLYVLSPEIARFYREPELIGAIRVLGTLILISGLKNIQQAYVSKHLMFRKFFWATIIGTICSAVLGIAMAYRGFGYWSLIAQYLSNAIIDTAILWIVVPWRPQLRFSIKKLKALFSFGWKLLISELLNTGYKNLRQLIIGKIYSPSDLAYYNKGDKLPNLIVANMNTSINSILFPIMSECQNDRERVRAITRKSIKMCSYILWPIMMGLAVSAEEVISILFSDAWLEAAKYVRILCFSFVFHPLNYANLSALKAVGRSDLYLTLEILKKVVGLAILVFTVPRGVVAIAIGTVIEVLISTIINAYPNKKCLNYTIHEQIRDILPYMLLSMVMAALISPIKHLQIGKIYILLVQVVLGIVVYCVESFILKIDMFCELKEMMETIIKKIIFKNKA